MSEFAQGVGLRASNEQTAGAGRRRGRALPLWLRALVVLAATAGLWALIFAAGAALLGA